MSIRNRLAEAKIYTMRQLNVDTAGVIKEINDDGRPAFITRRGRFVAMITPLANAGLEAVAVDAIVAEAERRAQYEGTSVADGLMSTEVIADELDVQIGLPSSPRTRPSR